MAVLHNGQVKSKLLDGFIIPPGHLELIAVDHCNISCKYCNHAAPAMPAWYAEPDKVYRDFSILAKYYRPSFIKVIGGEPLLHPNLVALIQAARSSGISNRVLLTTNGILLDTASNALWEVIDEIEISLYPYINISKKNISQAQKKAESLGKKFTIFEYELFRATFALNGTSDKEFVRKVFAACKFANLWGCHAVRDGFFYKCPKSIYIPLLKNQTGMIEGVAIVDSNFFQSELLGYLNSPSPLPSCRYCAGTTGKREPVCLMPYKNWCEDINRTLEDIVDHDWLERSLLVQDRFDDCKFLSHWIMPDFFLQNKWMKRISKLFWPIVSNLWMRQRKKRCIRQSAKQARSLHSMRKD